MALQSATGNLVSHGQFFYQYDGLNRLVRVSHDPALTAGQLDPNTGTPAANWGGGSVVADFAYDGLGRLIRTDRSGGQASSDHYYDGVRRIQDGSVDPNDGVVVCDYVWGPGYVDEILAQFSNRAGGQPRRPFTYLQDASYNVVAILDRFGNTAWQYAHEPYGEVAAAEADPGTAPNLRVVNRIGHQGLFFERFLTTINEAGGAWFFDPNAVGIYLTRNRAYAPRLGRWLSRDMNESAQPVVAALAMNGQTLDLAFGGFSALGQFGDGMNLYAAYGSNPVNRRDPLGLYDDPFEEVDEVIFGIQAQRASALAEGIAFWKSWAIMAARGALLSAVAATGPLGLLASSAYMMIEAGLDMNENGLTWNNTVQFGFGALPIVGAIGAEYMASVRATAGAVNRAARAMESESAALLTMRHGRRSLGICFAARTLVWTGNGLAAIETIDVGERVLTSEWLFLGAKEAQPAAGDAQPAFVTVGARVSAAGMAESDTSIVPDSWRLITLEIAGPDDSGDIVQVRTLRPVEWLVESGCRPGQAFWFELPEMGLSGPAVVRSVGPCPPIEPGPGRVVLSTTVSCSETVLRLTLAGQDEPIELTAGHRLFSEDRDDWVPAGEMVRNERLRTLGGPAEIVEIASQAGVRTVYNLEVETEHWYFVSGAGVLSHNQNPCAQPFRPRGEWHQGVWFDDAGFPDFGPHAIKDVRITPAGSRYADEAAANAAAGLRAKPVGYTWHHHQEVGRMQLVPTDLHASVGHDGGFSIWGGG